MKKQILAVIALLSQVGADAQIREFPERGIYPTGSYTISDIETINNVNGNLFLSIPIVQMPPGRSAYAGPVRLNYNSALFDVTLGTPTYLPGYRKTITLSEDGGWSYGFDYGIRVVERPSYSGGTDCTQDADVNTFKYLLLMPDGGKKELTFSAQHQADTLDGYYRIHPQGLYFSCPLWTSLGGAATKGTMVLYTTDGSHIRVEIPYDNSVVMANQTWRVYLPDGGMVEGKSDYTTKVTDANGWSVTYTRTFDPQGATTAFTIKEDQPPFRTITATTPSKPTSLSTDTFTWSGYGASLSTQVTWGAVNSGDYTYTCESGGPGVLCTLNGGRAVVTSVRIPKAVDTLPDFQYDFEYRDVAHCTAAVQCFGQLGTIRFPAGTPADRLVANYEYALDGSGMTPEYLDNPVKKKTVSYVAHMDGPTGTAAKTETTTINVGNGSTVFTNAAGGVTTYYFRDPRMPTDPMRGLVYRVTNPDGSEVERLWLRNRPSNVAAGDPGNPYVRLEVSTVPNAAGAAARSWARQTTVDTNGNSRIVSEYDWVNYASVGRLSGVLTDTVSGSLLRRVTNTYHNAAELAPTGGTAPADLATAYWNAGAPRNLRALKRSETANGSLAVQAAVEIDYANPLVGNNKTQERRWDSALSAGNAPLDASNSAITSYTYNCPGLVETVTDPNGYQAKTSYGAECLFPVSQTQALGRPEARTTTFTHDAATGLMTQTSDTDNSVQTIFDYDRLGRRTLTREAANTQEERKTVAEYDDVNRKVVTKRDRLTVGDGQLVGVSYFDSRGLPWLSLTSENGAVPDSACASDCIKVERRSETIAGYFVEAVSNPYRPSGDSDTRGFSVTEKDAGGRVRRVTGYSGTMAAAWPWASGGTSMGTTATAYDGETTTVQDAAGKTRTFVADALGRTTSAAAGPMSTINSYDALGNLRQVTQGGQVRTFNYSSLSRLVSSTQPENGTTSYSYDANGNLLTRTNGVSMAVTFKTPVGAAATEKPYDGLNRPRRKTIPQPGGTEKDVVWTWDTAVNGKGQLGSIAYGDTTVSYGGYDPLGRVTSHSQKTGTVTYPFAYEYFRNDELKKITYPSGRAVSYALDNAGRVASATGSTGTAYVNGVTYAAHGGMRQMDLGGVNKLRAEWTAYNGQLQMEQFRVLRLSAPGTPLLELGYGYGGSANNGNPVTATIKDGTATRTQNFDYDGANRLWKACEANVGLTGCTVDAGVSWTGAGYGQVFGYDTYGNRWVDPAGTVPALTWQPTGPGAFDGATNRFNAATFGGTFDGAGQMTAQFAASAQAGDRADEKWDGAGQRVESKFTTKDAVSNTNTMAYDGLGRRVQKVNPAVGETIFVYDVFGNLAAEYGAGSGAACGPCYVFADPVGSVRLVVDQSEAVVKRYDTLPFGEPIREGDGWANGRTGTAYASGAGVKFGFGGSYKDEETGEWAVNVMGARQYRAGYGRFVTPDENLVDQEAGDPVSWNLYGYGRSSPLRYSDPSGRACIVGADGDYDDGGPGQPCAEARKAQEFTFDGSTNAMTSSAASDGLSTSGQLFVNQMSMRRDGSNQMIATVAAGSTAAGVAGGIATGTGMIVAVIDGVAYTWEALLALGPESLARLAAAGKIGQELWTRLEAAVGPLGNWIRVGSSYSLNLQQKISLSIRWGASPVKGGKYLNQIGSPILRDLNQWIRGQRVPLPGWRAADPGHFHLKK